jgi:pyruvate dehydrogenase E1 component alpha subunit
MLLIRRFEEKAGQFYGMGKIGGFCHLYIGQEAVAVGVEHSIKGTDTVITSYRDHGTMLARGSDPNSIMSELLGKESGCSGGKGGSMHIFDLERNFFGGHGIVGSQVSIGTGIAFAHKYKNNNSISVIYFGDGAVNQGQVYESFNMAALWKLPVIYAIENNMYGMGTSVSRASANEDLYNRGESFGIPGYQVNGMDIFDVIKNTEEAVKYVRSGKGPVILEFKTYRYRGHSMSDPATYRTKEEVTEYKDNHDPIGGLKEYILKNKFSDTETLKNIERNIKNRIKEVAEFSENSNFPAEAELDKNIYHTI